MSLATLLAAAGAAALSSAGCYNPSVVDGKLLCGPANACPDGFSCVEGRCWRGGVVDSGMTDDGPALDLACMLPLNCTPSGTGACDTVCQTGCDCTRDKCTIDGQGLAACVKVKGLRQPLESCTISDYGSAKQSDDCAPGSVCIRPDPNGTNAWCFALCASDDNCPGARCVARAVGPPSVGSPTASVCDVPFVDCDPFASPSEGNNRCPGTRPYCYLSSPDPTTGASRTVCEFTTGDSGAGGSCTWSRDCFPNLVCPRADGDPSRRGVGFCVAPCDKASHGCGIIGTCQAYGTNYGYCN